MKLGFFPLQTSSCLVLHQLRKNNGWIFFLSVWALYMSEISRNCYSVPLTDTQMNARTPCCFDGTYFWLWIKQTNDSESVVFAGVPGVRPERFEEGLAVKHCALSLVGEPIMYPEINAFLRLLHQQRISSFLVTNAQFPNEIRYTSSKTASRSRLSTAAILF